MKKINIERKTAYKFGLLTLAFLIGFSSLIYTNEIVKKLSFREQKLIDLYAKGLEAAITSDNSGNLTFLFQEIIEANNSIPVILTDENKNPISQKNLKIPKHYSSDERNKFLLRKVSEMEGKYEPIMVKIDGIDFVNYIFYEDSDLLKQLKYFPYAQLSAIAILMLLSYWALNYTRKSEQNKVWVGLAKETAHQLGTPISGLMAWIELLRHSPDVEKSTLDEMEKDIFRLATVTERFSNIGSIPQLKHEDLVKCIQNMVDYLDKRSSQNIRFEFRHEMESLRVWLNRPLFEWVIENLCKNAIDSISSKGEITIDITAENHRILIDVKDTGKGMSKVQMKKVFQAGFTTKQRGWGLGLTLAKRIIEQYHNGKIFVKETELGKGSTFRIELPFS
ncbi:MAG: HAMP domain-containing sensor histidine kinase [Cytophagales bacterium]